MHKLKIAIVANSCWNIFNFRKELIRHFNMAGHHVIVIAPIDEYIHYLNEMYFAKHIPLNHLKSQSASVLKDLLLLKELYFIYKKEQPDLIFHFTIKPNIYGSLVARFLKLKCVSTLTGLGYTFSQWKYRVIYNKIYKWALSQNEKIVFHNADDLKLFVFKKWVDPDKSIVIPGSGIDVNKFRAQVSHKDNDRFIFLFAGRLLKNKGLVEFVNAAIETRSIVKNVEFWVIGEFNIDNPNSISKDVLVHWVESRIIKYFGQERDVRKFISKANVLVLPSYREGLSRAILEAMSMEKPIITTDVAGCRELVKDHWNGLLVPPKDVHELAKAMVNMYNFSEEEREMMGKNSRKLVKERYDLSIVLQVYDELIEELIVDEVFSDHNYRDSF